MDGAANGCFGRGQIRLNLSAAGKEPQKALPRYTVGERAQIDHA